MPTSAAFEAGSVAGRDYAQRVDVKLHAFPSRDREFQDFAQAAFNVLAEPRTPEALQRALRIRYPAAAVTEQAELARHGDGPTVWYAFRTAAVGVPPLGAEAAAAAPDAWAIIDDERRFIEVSPSLAKIVELPARRVIGHRIEDFTNPADPTIRDDIARLWLEFKDGGAIASTLRFNYADGRPRELAYRLTADDDGEGRHRLVVRVMPPAE
jgi:PAS domain S-box-containing protein